MIGGDDERGNRKIESEINKRVDIGIVKNIERERREREERNEKDDD